MSRQIEASVQCPWCFEEIEVLIDPSEDRQTYIEDCSVCCRPIRLSASCGDGELLSLDAERD